MASFRSVNYQDNPGGFELFARNDTVDYVLTGKTDGTLQWKGENVLRLAYYDGLGVTTFAESPEGVFIVGNGTSGASDSPAGGSHGILTTVLNIGTKFQTFQPDNKWQVYKRCIIDGNWGGWKPMFTAVNFYNAGAISSGYCSAPTIVNVMCTNGDPRITVNGVQIWGTAGYHGEYSTGVCFLCPQLTGWSMSGANVDHVTYAVLGD